MRKKSGTMKNLSELLTPEIHSVGITGHMHPDGDCAGSVLAVYAYLTENFSGIRVDPYLDLPLSSEIEYLLSGEPVRSDEGKGEQYDLMIILDSATPDRLSAGKEAYKKAAHTVVIDHHETNPAYGDENYIDGNASSACEVLMRYMDIEKISMRTAYCLYSGIIFDTNVFRYDATSPETLRDAALLIEKGVPFAEIIRESVMNRPLKVARVTAAVTEQAVLNEEDRFIYAILDQEMLRSFGVTTSDIGGVVSELNTIREAETTLLLYEFEDGTWKASLRSKTKVDVSKIAADLGGGGHVRAAGFSFSNTDPVEIVEKILAKVREQMQGGKEKHG